MEVPLDILKNLNFERHLFISKPKILDILISIHVKEDFFLYISWCFTSREVKPGKAMSSI